MPVVPEGVVKTYNEFISSSYVEDSLFIADIFCSVCNRGILPAMDVLSRHALAGVRLFSLNFR